MSRRPNGAGSMYKRGRTWYSRMKINGEFVRLSLGTTDRVEARRRLDKLAKGHDLPDDERLAALMVHFKPKSARRTFDAAWEEYTRSPVNIAQTEHAQSDDYGAWKTWMRWLHGQDVLGSRLNCKATHPEVICLDDANAKVAAEFVEWLKANRSPQTSNKIVRILRRVWRLNGMDDNPWAAFRKFKTDASKRRAFSREEVDMIIDRADGELKVLFTIGAYTGMRLGDCVNLRYESIDGKAGVIRTGKTGKVVRIPIHPKLLAAIGRLKPSGYVLPVMSTWPRWKVSDAVQSHLRACGLEEPVKRDGYKKASSIVGFHSLRSTFITRLGEAGVPLPVVRDMVGHVSEEMTMRYFRNDDAMAKRAIAALG